MSGLVDEIKENLFQYRGILNTSDNAFSHLLWLRHDSRKYEGVFISSKFKILFPVPVPFPSGVPSLTIWVSRYSYSPSKLLFSLMSFKWGTVILFNL